MKVHVKFIALGERLRVITDGEFDLTSGCGLPAVGDCVHLFDEARANEKFGQSRQFWVVERHWNIGNIIGEVEIYVAPTSEQARTITSFR